MQLRDGIIRVADASSIALNSMRKMSGMHTDPDIVRYESFKPEDFAALSDQYGSDNVLDYINEMERKRLAPVK